MKYLSSCRSWECELRLAIVSMAVAVSFNAQAKEATFEQVFNTKHEPVAIHYQALFISNGAEHQLEVWRDGDHRIKRRTDDALEVYADRKPGDPEFHMSILDKKKRLHTQIDRVNLYRIGNFTDWFDLAHGLRHPKGAYQLVKASVPEGAQKPIQRCDWFALTRDKSTTHICWSRQSRLPLLMQSQEGNVVWRITSLDRNPIPATTFEIHDEGYVRTNANDDIERD